MGIQVTGQTLGVFGQNPFAVGLLVTAEAVGNEPVLQMAADAIDLSVPAPSPGPGDVDLRMALLASLGFNLQAEGNLQRFVRGMASSAALGLLSLEVGTVAIQTGGQIPVLLIMTGIAFLLRVAAGKALSLLGRRTVALAAVVGQPGRHRYPARSMGILVTAQALEEACRVGQAVAHGALGPGLFPVRHVEALVTVLAENFMAATSLAQGVEDRRMAAAALGRGEWRQLNIIKAVSHGRPGRRRRGSLTLAGGHSRFGTGCFGP